MSDAVEDRRYRSWVRYVSGRNVAKWSDGEKEEESPICGVNEVEEQENGLIFKGKNEEG